MSKARKKSSTTSTVPTDAVQHPVHIASLTLHAIRAHAHLQMDLSLPDEERGQWIVILGENGAGKTTLLQSLALAMRNIADRTIWPQSALSTEWLHIGKAASNNPNQGYIAVTPANAGQQRTIITRNGITNYQQIPEQTMPSLFPFFAYGCHRGSPMGGPARAIDLSERDGIEIATLFDDSGHLINAEGWLKDLERKSFKDNTVYQAIFEAVMTALTNFLAVKALDLTVDGLFVTGQDGQRLPFSTLSDGYLSSAGWLLDLLARWLNIAQRLGQPIGSDFMSQMCGLVLIDEIDLHLHPRWQIEIITRTRRLLPKMSFIVTTHNPLTLVGAKAEEIWILERENGKISARRGNEMPKLLTGGQLYSQYFGIEDMYPDGLGQALNRYSFLSGFAMRNDDEQAELEQLQARLREEGILPEWDVVERIMPPPTKRPTPKRTPKAKKGSTT